MTTTTLRVQQLSYEAFKDFGTFAPMTPPDATALVAGDIISFWPDCGGVLSIGPSGNNEMAIGICQVAWREFKVDVTEYHSSTGEGNIPLDGDIIIHVARPTTGDTPPADGIELFYVPKGTAVIMKPGVWHHAPFAVSPGEVVNTVILLPQRTYANDCIVREINPPVNFTR